MTKHDPVENPSHYTDGCSRECIDMMQTAIGWEGVMHFCLCNAYKYLWRYKLKNNPMEDLQKANWYVKRAIVMARDDPETWGYILTTADRIMNLVELYTIREQAYTALHGEKAVTIIPMNGDMDADFWKHERR